jgi:hypothetical protein
MKRATAEQQGKRPIAVVNKAQLGIPDPLEMMAKMAALAQMVLLVAPVPMLHQALRSCQLLINALALHHQAIAVLKDNQDHLVKEDHLAPPALMELSHHLAHQDPLDQMDRTENLVPKVHLVIPANKHPALQAPRDRPVHQEQLVNLVHLVNQVLMANLAAQVLLVLKAIAVQQAVQEMRVLKVVPVALERKACLDHVPNAHRHVWHLAIKNIDLFMYASALIVIKSLAQDTDID